MRYESLRANKRKTARSFFASRLKRAISSSIVRGFPKTAGLSAYSKRKFIIVSAEADCESVFGKLLWFNAMFQIKPLWLNTSFQIRQVIKKNNRFLRQFALLLYKNTQLFCNVRQGNRAVHWITWSLVSACNECEAWSSPRNLQRVRSTKFPAQESPAPSNTDVRRKASRVDVFIRCCRHAV